MFRVATHLGLVTVIFLVALASAFFIIYVKSPQTASWWEFAVLYGSLFFLVFSVGTLLGYLVQRAMWRKAIHYEQWRVARRQGILLGFLAVLGLLMQVTGLLNWETGILLLAVFLLIELYAQ